MLVGLLFELTILLHLTSLKEFLSFSSMTIFYFKADCSCPYSRSSMLRILLGTTLPIWRDYSFTLGSSFISSRSLISVPWKPLTLSEGNWGVKLVCAGDLSCNAEQWSHFYISFSEGLRTWSCCSFTIFIFWLT